MGLGLAPGMERCHLVSLVQPIGHGHRNAEQELIGHVCHGCRRDSGDPLAIAGPPPPPPGLVKERTSEVEGFSV